MESPIEYILFLLAPSIDFAKLKKKNSQTWSCMKVFRRIRLHPMLQMTQSARMNASQFPVSRDQGKFHLVRRFPIDLSLSLSLFNARLKPLRRFIKLFEII